MEVTHQAIDDQSGTTERGMRVPLRVKKGTIGTVHSVLFHLEMPTVQATVQFALCKRPDETLIKDSVVDFLNRPRIIVMALFDTVAANIAQGWVTKQIDIPGDGIKVTNELSLIWRSSVTINPFVTGVSVFYSLKSVSLEKWMQIAKSQ